jgi:SAM-dependent methyltransferase
MFEELSNFLAAPELYAPSSAPFWDDEYISKNMLKTHLDSNTDAASRKPGFLDRSANWIAKIAPPAQYTSLLDLGCGPGLYAERFSAAGYSVTGVDFSRRSIGYAKEQTLLHGTNIDYHYQDYLTIDYTEQFDVITLIYLDYAALSDNHRLALLKKVYQALKPNGKFIFDVSTPIMRKGEMCSWKYYENGGFFSEGPYICLESVRQYDEASTKLSQYIVVTEDGVECYCIWDRFFTKEALLSEVQTVGFRCIDATLL